MIKEKQLKRFGTTYRKAKRENPKLIVKIHLKYPHYKEVIDYPPKQRMKQIETQLNKRYRVLCKKLDAVGKPLEGNGPRSGLRYEISFLKLVGMNLQKDHNVSYSYIQAFY